VWNLERWMKVGFARRARIGARNSRRLANALDCSHAVAHLVPEVRSSLGLPNLLLGGWLMLAAACASDADGSAPRSGVQAGSLAPTASVGAAMDASGPATGVGGAGVVPDEVGGAPLLDPVRSARPSLVGPPSRTGGSGGGTGAAEECDAVRLLAEQCGGSACHSAGAPMRVDLVTAGVEARLVDVASDCGGASYVSSSDPESSYVLDKLSGQPACGVTMPLGSDLSDVEIECITRWVASLVMSN